MMKSFLTSKNLWVATACVLAAALLFWFSTALGIGGQDAEHRPAFARSSLVIMRADGQKVNYTVEVARTHQEQAYGLMFVRNLAHDTGMIFVNPTDHVEYFWMKNTFIPLDMLFIRADGVVVKVISNAKPFDETPLSSDVPVRAVLEINGGDAAQRGLKAGDKVLFEEIGA